jgi:ornithine decarboxylase
VDNGPFYVMNADRVNDLLDVWAKCLPRVQPFYSLKCNTDPVLLRLLALNPWLGLNTSAPKELETALNFVAQERVLCSNPCWTRPALGQAAERGAQLLTFESDRDLDRILCNHPEADLLLHICANPDSEDTEALFGCPIEKAPELLQLAAELGLRCVGISFNVGADSDRPSSLFGHAIEWSARLFRVGADFGHRMNVLNMGDGFASPQNEWECAQFAQV